MVLCFFCGKATGDKYNPIHKDCYQKRKRLLEKEQPEEIDDTSENEKSSTNVETIVNVKSSTIVDEVPGTPSPPPPPIISNNKPKISPYFQKTITNTPVIVSTVPSMKNKRTTTSTLPHNKTKELLKIKPPIGGKMKKMKKEVNVTTNDKYSSLNTSNCQSFIDEFTEVINKFLTERTIEGTKVFFHNWHKGFPDHIKNHYIEIRFPTIHNNGSIVSPEESKFNEGCIKSGNLFLIENKVYGRTVTTSGKDKKNPQIYRICEYNTNAGKYPIIARNVNDPNDYLPLKPEQARQYAK